MDDIVIMINFEIADITGDKYFTIILDSFFNDIRGGIIKRINTEKFNRLKEGVNIRRGDIINIGDIRFNDRFILIKADDDDIIIR